MTDEDLVAIEARLQAATPGPWVFDSSTCYIWGPKRVMVADDGADEGVRLRGFGAKLPIDNNGDLIAQAPTDLADLVAEVRRLQATLDVVRGALADIATMTQREVQDGMAQRKAARVYGDTSLDAR